MDRAQFYGALRSRGFGLFGTSLSSGQVNGIEAILNEAQKRGTPLKQLAYIFATTAHETAQTMQPIAEYGKGKGRKYGVPAGPYGKVYYGRGFVQLTWLENYEHAGYVLGVELVKYPEKALDLGIATEILFSGMAEGWFTGKKLSDYILGDKADYAGARRIINGTDRAALIAGYAESFAKALRAAGYVGQAPAKPLVIPPEPALPGAEPAPAPPVPGPLPVVEPPVPNPAVSGWVVLFGAIAKLFKKQ
jgi:putative chitinase